MMQTGGDLTDRQLVSNNEPAEVSVTAIAPINIAVVKYWGKRDEKYNLPLHSSLSVTLGLTELSSKTCITASPDLEDDEFWLNGRKMDTKGDRFRKCLDEVRRKCCKRKREDHDKLWFQNSKLKITSENNFPTAAGLASSASGYAALVYGLGKFYGIQGDLSMIARLGSGSACRSMLGGFVKWEMGKCPYGSDSVAKQVATENHWPELHVLILVVHDQRKAVSSTDGMKRSAATSELLHMRATHIVPQRIRQMDQAIQKRDFQTFAELTMKESNQFHAICQDTYPPIVPPYLNATSLEIIAVITKLNTSSKTVKAAYTFDAGPNAFVFTTEKYLQEVVHLLMTFFGPSSSTSNGEVEGCLRGLPFTFSTEVDGAYLIPKEYRDINVEPSPGKVKSIIHTKPGPGPKFIDMQNSVSFEV